MSGAAKIIEKLSEKAKIELSVFAQGRREIIDPFIDEELEDAQTELDILYELGFLDLDGDEDDEEYARAEFSSDVRQYLNEEIGRMRQTDLIMAVLDNIDQYDDLEKETPTAFKEIEAMQSKPAAPDASEPDILSP